MAAVVGRDFTYPVLQAVSDLPEDRLLDVLDEAEGARLIEDAPGVIDGYTFTHALIRETLYGDLTTARRVRFHRRVAEALEEGMKPGQEPLADLAYHYGQAASRGDVEKAVSFAVRAGEAAAARFAVDEAARFYGMALQALSFLPDDAAVRARRLELQVKSGKALASIGQWPQARAQFEGALTLLEPQDRERRAELLVLCSDAAFWSLDIPALRQFANEAVEIANAIGRDDLWADAMACLGTADNSEGNVLKAVESDRRVIEVAGGVRTFSMARSAISLYHAGLTEESILRSSQSVASARSKDDPAFLVYSLSHYGLSCSGVGRYDEAQRAFDEARVVGRRYGILPFLARSIAMSTGMHTALGDLATAENLANEARDLSRQVAFPPALISTGIDLLFIYTRGGELGRAEGILDEVGQAVRSAGGWHGWLWRIRLNQVVAEMALAREDWRGAEENASTGISQSRARHRVKYEALGLITRARARMKTGDIASAVQDASSAVEIARRLGDPSVLLEALTAHLDVEGNDVLLGEARSSIDKVLQGLSDERLRQRFLDSENVHRLLG